MKTIEKLSPSVVNRIAAGEIIHHPYNAVKELIENSLDAKATYIQIYIDNSMTFIQIIDNGCGIKIDDMPLVCERYATSKLKEFNDLSKLTTFGFRGEALASISQIAKVVIASKPKDNTCGYQAIYQNGKLLGKPKLCASSNGTRITIQNLFENMPIRKKALLSNPVERQHISDTIKKYAIHNTNVQFMLKREQKTEITCQKVSNQLDRIQQIYGTCISSCLKSAEYTDSKCKFSMLFNSSIESQKNKSFNIFILFVNDRLVENNSIKKEMKQAYTNISNGCKPSFIYISLTVDPSHIDVNIHPAKNEIRLLDEKDIIDKMTTTLKSILSSSTLKKKYNLPVQLSEKSTLDYYFKPANNTSVHSETDSSSLNTPPHHSIRKGKINDYFKNTKNSITNESSMVQNISKNISNGKSTTLQPIDINRVPQRPTVQNISKKVSNGKSSAFQPTDKTPTVQNKNNTILTRYCMDMDWGTTNENAMVQNISKNVSNRKSAVLQPVDINCVPQRPIVQNAIISRNHKDMYLKNPIAPTIQQESTINQELSDEDPGNLDSIVTIKSEITQAEDKGLSNIVKKSQCISVIDDILALVVYKDCFYLINYNTISEEYFYQVIIYQIGKFGNLILSTPISIQSCISLFMPNATVQELNAMVQSIVDHKDLLKSYYNIEISNDKEDAKLICLPMILLNYVPSMDKLPIFLHNLATQIDWENEIECLDAIAREISSFYCYCFKEQFKHFFNEFKAPKYLIEKGYITELKFPLNVLL